MAWPTFPTSVDCLNGTAPPPPGVIGPRDPSYFVNRMAEVSRKGYGMEDGSIVVLGCSHGNYVPFSKMTPYAVDYTIAGNDLRYAINQLAGDHTLAWTHNSTTNNYAMKGLTDLDRAGGVIIYGLIHNHINMEMSEWNNSGDMLADAELMLEQLADWLTGPLLIFEDSPVIESLASYGVTNARIDAINTMKHTIFGSRSDTYLVELNTDFKDTGGELKSAYSLDGCHLSQAGIDEVVARAKVGLTALGLD
jgi:hypothetical protein